MLFRRTAPQQAKPRNGSAPSASQSSGTPSTLSTTSAAGEDDLRQMWDAVAALLDDTTIRTAHPASESPDAVAPQAGVTPTAGGAQPAVTPADSALAPDGAGAEFLVSDAVYAPLASQDMTTDPAPGAASDVPPAADLAPFAATPPAAEKTKVDPFYLRIFRPSQAAPQAAVSPAGENGPNVAGAAVLGAAALGAATGGTGAVGAGAVGASAAGAVIAGAGDEATAWEAPAQTAIEYAPDPSHAPAQAEPVWDATGVANAALDPAVAAGAAAVLAAAPQPYALRVPGSPFSLPDGLDPNAVNIRGRNEGVAVEIGAGHWQDVLNLLSYRLEQSSGFFRNGMVAVDVSGRALNEFELSAMRNVMVAFEMDPSVVRTASERTFQSGLALGMAMTQVAPDGTVVNEAQKAVASGSPSGYYVYRGSLRSGQIFYRHEHVIILGDVNPGAEVISDGDVLVWGRLRGTAHAGARGNSESVVGALDLDPVQLRIDRVIGAAQAGMSEKGPRWGTSRSAQRRPEIARLVGGRLSIEPWDEIRTPGGPILKTRRN